MWNNYPKHELEKIKILPPFEEYNKDEKEEIMRPANPKAVSHKDLKKHVFKVKSWFDEI